MYIFDYNEDTTIINLNFDTDSECKEAIKKIRKIANKSSEYYKLFPGIEFNSMRHGPGGNIDFDTELLQRRGKSIRMLFEHTSNADFSQCREPFEELGAKSISIVRGMLNGSYPSIYFVNGKEVSHIQYYKNLFGIDDEMVFESIYPPAQREEVTASCYSYMWEKTETANCFMKFAEKNGRKFIYRGLGELAKAAHKLWSQNVTFQANFELIKHKGKLVSAAIITDNVKVRQPQPEKPPELTGDNLAFYQNGGAAFIDGYLNQCHAEPFGLLTSINKKSIAGVPYRLMHDASKLLHQKALQLSYCGIRIKTTMTPELSVVIENESENSGRYKLKDVKEYFDTYNIHVDKYYENHELEATLVVKGGRVSIRVYPDQFSIQISAT